MTCKPAIARVATLSWLGHDLSHLILRETRKGLWFCLVAALLTMFKSSAAAQSATNLPAFQFGAFYNLDLEIENGQPLTMNGPVFCNANMWVYPSGSLTFNSTVQTVSNYYHQQPPNDEQNQPGSGAVTFALPNQPSTNVPPLIRLVLPFTIYFPCWPPSVVEATLNVPPPPYVMGSPTAYTANGQIYLANECDLIISNSMSGTNGAWGTNVTICYQDPSAPNGPLIGLTNEMFTFSNFYTHSTNLWTTNSPKPPNATNYILVAAGFPFVTNVAFYDYREQDTVQAVQLDVAQFGQWLTNAAFEGNWWNGQCFNHKGHPIDSIWVYNSVQGNGKLPAVRMVNGQQMPSCWGLTVATPQPIYVQGHYNVTTNNGASTSIGTTNTANTWPAALMGDAITILSGNWSDAYNASTSLSSRNVTSNITINAALLAGIVPSTNVAGKKWYSGGLENFLRLEEDWSSGSRQLWYNGSMVAMFPSIYATNFWVPPSSISGYPTPYYGIPTRKWGFDYRFLNLSSLPPCTPTLVCPCPVITVQPQSQTAPLGYTATLNVVATVATGESLQYLWYHNGTNIPSATNSTLVLTNVQFSQAGTYDVWVGTECFGGPISSNAVLTVVAQPLEILTQPTNQTIPASSNVTFSVTVDGVAPFSYQWSFNGTDIAGATNASFTLTNVSTNDEGNYRVIITNLYGSVTSSNAVLSVYASAAAMLDAFLLSGGNTVQFEVTGVPGFNYAVQASTNLVDWETLITNASPFDFLDTDITNFPVRFYRAIYLP